MDHGRVACERLLLSGVAVDDVDPIVAWPLGGPLVGVPAVLEAMGLQETRLRQLLQALETLSPAQQQNVTKAVSSTFSRITEMLDQPGGNPSRVVSEGVSLGSGSLSLRERVRVRAIVPAI